MVKPQDTSLAGGHSQAVTTDVDWGTARWRGDVGTWVATVLAGHGAALSTALQESETRPWSTVWTAGTSAGWSVWFKAAEPRRRAEPRVHDVLARIAPRWVDAPLGTDPGRGWTLTRDGGPTVSAAGPPGSRGMVQPALDDLLADYAALQRATFAHGDTLTAAGLTIMHPGNAAALAAEQATSMGAFPPSDARHLASAQVQAVLAAGPALSAAADILLAGPVPLGFDHGDLFPRNVFTPREPDGPYRFFDFAESVWAHPFGSLVMLIPELLHRYGVGTPPRAIDCRDPRIRAVIDGYLGHWTDLASLPQLRELAAAALRIAPLHRSTPWLETLEDADDDVLARHGRTPWAWLEDTTRTVLL